MNIKPSPQYGLRTAIRLTSEQRAWIAATAETNHCTMTDVVRACIEEQRAREETNQ